MSHLNSKRLVAAGKVGRNNGRTEPAELRPTVLACAGRVPVDPEAVLADVKRFAAEQTARSNARDLALSRGLPADAAGAAGPVGRAGDAPAAAVSCSAPQDHVCRAPRPGGLAPQAERPTVKLCRSCEWFTAAVLVGSTPPVREESNRLRSPSPAGVSGEGSGSIAPMGKSGTSPVSGRSPSEGHPPAGLAGSPGRTWDAAPGYFATVLNARGRPVLCEHTHVDFLRSFLAAPGLWSGIPCGVCGHVSGEEVARG